MANETLVRAARNTTDKYINEREKQTAYLEFINGAKWQAERMYSDFINWIDEREIPRENGLWIMYFNGKDNYLTTKELFEQFKKKDNDK